MCVADVRFFTLGMAPVVVDVAVETEEMGTFMPSMAQERPAEAAVEADTIVLRGVFREALKRAIEETEADVVVLGAPVEGRV